MLSSKDIEKIKEWVEGHPGIPFPMGAAAHGDPNVSMEGLAEGLKDLALRVSALERGLMLPKPPLGKRGSGGSFPLPTELHECVWDGEAPWRVEDYWEGDIVHIQQYPRPNSSMVRTKDIPWKKWVAVMGGE